MEAFAIDPYATRDLSPRLLDECSRLRVVATSLLADTSPPERMMFGVRNGLYSFPTNELIQFLTRQIVGRTAVENGAGHGALAKALELRATDNRQQEEPAVRAHYQALGQPTVPYGENVERLDALAAVEKYRPQVAVACCVTHRFDPLRPEAGGSASGVDEAKLISMCDEYIFVGNEHVHRHKPILDMAHETMHPSWLYSRALNGSREFIAIWRRKS